MSNIRLSPKHGVNPSLSQCFYCGGDKNEIVLPGQLPGDREAPRRAVWSKEPCDECKGLMAAGVMLIGVRDGETGDTPYRNGRLCVVTQQWVDRVISEPTRSDMLKRRCAFIEESVWAVLGLPTENIDNRVPDPRTPAAVADDASKTWTVEHAGKKESPE